MVNPCKPSKNIYQQLEYPPDFPLHQGPWVQKSVMEPNLPWGAPAPFKLVVPQSAGWWKPCVFSRSSVGCKGRRDDARFDILKDIKEIPISSMYSIFTYSWLICMKVSIPWGSGCLGYIVMYVIYSEVYLYMYHADECIYDYYYCFSFVSCKPSTRTAVRRWTTDCEQATHVVKVDHFLKF